MTELPTGTVTLLFTDIEGSTRLLHELGDRYVDALAEHRRIMREAFEKHGGVEVDTQGDAFFFAFPRASAALAAAGQAQQALEHGPISVRMGIHTGEPVVTEEGYVGLDVHRAARVMGAGHGGQVLVSEATARLVEAGLRDLGEHRLKDLSAPQRLFQLGGGEFPPPKTLYRTNLPIQPAQLVGRARARRGRLAATRPSARDPHRAGRLGQDAPRASARPRKRSSSFPTVFSGCPCRRCATTASSSPPWRRRWARLTASPRTSAASACCSCSTTWSSCSGPRRPWPSCWRRHRG